MLTKTCTRDAVRQMQSGTHLLIAPRTACVVFGRLAFGQDPNDGAEYMPHVSLLYGDLPMTTREDVGQVAESGLRDLEVELDCIEVWCTQGIVTEWELVGRFPLQQQPS